MPPIKAKDFIVDLNNLQAGKIIDKELSDELQSDQVLMKIDKFSFTSNNITYAIIGHQIGYWKFFPTEEGHGIIPAWGFAEVIASNHAEIQTGQRFYGYFPMSSHLLVTAGKVQPYGFVDVTAHRQALPPIYNYYINTSEDPMYQPEIEELQSVFRPLFTTSFLIDDLLNEQSFFGALNVVVTSASSKTAQALAFLLATRKREQNLALNIIGLTSKGNMDFVKGLGWYDQTLSYSQISDLDDNQPHVVVDFAGNHSNQYQLQVHLNEQLKYNCLVGLVDWQNQKGEEDLPQKGSFFFAPTYAQQRQKDWGAAGFQQRVGVAWQKFIGSVQKTLEIESPVGAVGLSQLYIDMLQGNIDPKKGNMVSISGE